MTNCCDSEAQPHALACRTVEAFSGWGHEAAAHMGNVQVPCPMTAVMSDV